MLELMPAQSSPPTARRLRALRTALGYATQVDFAAAIGIEADRYNNFERGHPLSHNVAMMLVQKFHGLSLDWLYLGRSDGLSVKMAELLGERGSVTTRRKAGGEASARG